MCVYIPHLQISNTLYIKFYLYYMIAVSMTVTMDAIHTFMASGYRCYEVNQN